MSFEQPKFEKQPAPKTEIKREELPQETKEVGGS